MLIAIKMDCRGGYRFACLLIIHEATSLGFCPNNASNNQTSLVAARTLLYDDPFFATLRYHLPSPVGTVIAKMDQSTSGGNHHAQRMKLKKSIISVPSGQKGPLDMRVRGKLVTLVALGIGLALLVATLVSSLDSFESQQTSMDRDARWTMHRISLVAILATFVAAILSFRRWVQDLEREVRERRENENRLKEAYDGSAFRGEERHIQLANRVECAPVEKPQTPVAAQHFTEATECSEEASQGKPLPCPQHQKRVINAREIIHDVRSGMTDGELMKKYRLSSMGLQSAFSKLLNSRLLTVDEIYGQPHRDDENNTVIIDDPRNVPSRFLTISVPLYEKSRAEMRGAAARYYGKRNEHHRYRGAAGRSKTIRNSMPGLP